MNTMILGLFAETSIHPGAGQSAGFVDLPVAREAATDYPVIVGSSFKGALRDAAEHSGKGDVERTFGKSDAAGDLLVSDARLLLLPVRSLTSQFKWVTCPHLIERLQRDRARLEPPANPPIGVSCPQSKYLGTGAGVLYLEERQFDFHGGLPSEPDLVGLLGGLMRHDSARNRLPEQLVVVSDKDFAWFARYGLAVTARNQLNENKTSNNLWYEETLPAESLFYTLLAERRDGAIEHVRSIFNVRPYLQVGGNETIGQGWFAVQIVEGGK
ncbi:MAG: type III-B CRISPR module RAMP protein Cmr4 [Thermoguttaceae bacterium]